VAVGDPLGTLVRSGLFAPWVDDHPITGLSLFCTRAAGRGVKLVCPETDLEPGDAATVGVESG
jgi:uncharacterized protein